MQNIAMQPDQASIERVSYQGGPDVKGGGKVRRAEKQGVRLRGDDVTRRRPLADLDKKWTTERERATVSRSCLTWSDQTSPG